MGDQNTPVRQCLHNYIVAPTWTTRSGRFGGVRCGAFTQCNMPNMNIDELDAVQSSFERAEDCLSTVIGSVCIAHRQLSFLLADSEY